MSFEYDEGNHNYYMLSLKKSLRLFLFGVLVILAVFGVGLSGGVPIPSLNKRREESNKIELVEESLTTSKKSGEFKG